MSPLTHITGTDLLAKEFPPMRWAVPGVIPEGLTELAGSPKVGKSWMVLDVGVSVATGQPVLGGIDVEAGDVLYLALEDGERRLQGRLNRILGDRPLPDRLTLATGTATYAEAVAYIIAWLDEHPDARLVVVDVFAKIKPQTNGKRSAYDEDYSALAPLQEIGTARGIAFMLVTHLRKAGAEDTFAEVSGSAGVTGAADAILVIKRARNESEAELHLTGRDVAEGLFEVRCDPEDLRWRLVGGSLQAAAERAAEARQTAGLGDRSAAIVHLVNEHPAGITPKDVAEAIDIVAKDAAQYLGRLLDAGRIARPSRGLYTPVVSVVTGSQDPYSRAIGDTTGPAASVVTQSPSTTDTTDTTHPPEYTGRCECPSGPFFADATGVCAKCNRPTGKDGFS
jgi:hypothetical protein